jgi:hypothetical protein
LADDLGAGRRRSNALGFLQALPQNLVINKTPDILHSLDQKAFVVTRRRPGLTIDEMGGMVLARVTSLYPKPLSK